MGWFVVAFGFGTVEIGLRRGATRADDGINNPVRLEMLCSVRPSAFWALVLFVLVRSWRKLRSRNELVPVRRIEDDIFRIDV